MNERAQGLVRYRLSQSQDMLDDASLLLERGRWRSAVNRAYYAVFYAGLALLACLPLFIPLAGLVRGKYRSMIWAGLLLMLYFTIGIMEAWSNPPQRLPALVQIVLPIFYLFAFKMRNRSQL